MSNTKDAILEKLAASRAELLTFIEGVADEDWQTAVFAPETDDALAKWSALDIVRHLVNAEWGMTSLMMNIQSGKGGVPEDLTAHATTIAPFPSWPTKPPPTL